MKNFEKELELLSEQHEEFVSAILEFTPDHYDGDEAAEEIAIRYVRDLEGIVKNLLESEFLKNYLRIWDIE